MERQASISGASVSSYGSTNNGGSTAGDTFRPPGGLTPGDDDQLEDLHTVQQGVFGVLYTVSKEKQVSSVSFVCFRMFLVLDIATLTLLLVTLDCNYFDVPASIRFHNQEFPDVVCWSMPHLVHVAVSVASIVVFFLMATSMVVSEVELNPLTRNYMAMAHTRVEGTAFIIKVAATIASVMVSSVKLLSVVYLVCFLVLFYLHVKWVPFVYSALNYVRCGSYATVLYCSVILVALAFTAGDTHQKVMTLAMWIGMAPAALAGAAACHLRLQHFNSFVLGRFRDAEPNVKSKFIYRFQDAREVEITARCCRRWIDEDTPEPEAVVMSEQVIKAGMIQLPQTAKKQSPDLLEHFAIFSREQEHTQRASGANGGGDNAVDLVAYVEFQRNHRVVVRAHREALIAMRSFWGLLLRNRVDFNHLSRALNRIEITVKAAERAYRGVLTRHSSSARLVRLYGRFLESIKFDPWAASKWYTEADRLEEEAENTKDALQLGGLETMLPGTNRGMASVLGIAVICVNAQNICQVASPEAHEMLGYGKNELKGKDIGILMPAPFGDRHAAYVRNYINTGKSSMLNKQQEVVVITKDKQVLPVMLRVAKVSGLNEDSVFLGVLELAPAQPNTARAWVLGNGTIIAADGLFCDWLGYEQADLIGTAVADAVVDKETMSMIIKIFSRDAKPAAATGEATTTRGRRGSIFGGTEPVPVTQSLPVAAGPPGEHQQLQQLEQLLFGDVPHLVKDKHAMAGAAHVRSGDMTMTTSLPRTAWHHKFGDPLQFDTVIAPGGRIQHATAALAAMLGRTPDTIRSGELGMLIPEPYSMLHGAYWQELARSQSIHQVTPIVPPPHSCRSGLAVSMVAHSEQGPIVKPFLLSMEQRLASRPGNGGSGTTKVNIVALEEVSMEESIEYLIDLFKPQALEVLLAGDPARPFGASLKPALSATTPRRGAGLEEIDQQRAEAVGATPEARIARVLLELARRSSEAPDCSWRVGVSLPPDAEAAQELKQLALALGPEDAQAATEFMGTRTVPAVMRVRLVRKSHPAWAAPAPAAATYGGYHTLPDSSTLHQAGAVVEATDMPVALQQTPPTMQHQQQPSRLRVASDNHTPPPAACCEPAVPAPALLAPSLCIEVELWRADLLSGVLEVDNTGKVLRVDATCPLGQSGLILGSSVSALLGCSMADLLPLPPGGVEALFDLPGPSGEAALQRGGLKQRKSTKRNISAPTILNTRHQGDGCAVELRVQAVRRAGPVGSAYLVLHPAHPTAVQPGFVRWLHTGDASGLMVEQTRGAPSLQKVASHRRNRLEAAKVTKVAKAAAAMPLSSSASLRPPTPLAAFPGLLSMPSIGQMSITMPHGGNTANSDLTPRLAQSTTMMRAEVVNPMPIGADLALMTSNSIPGQQQVQRQVLQPCASSVPGSAYDTGLTGFSLIMDSVLQMPTESASEQVLLPLASNSPQANAVSPPHHVAELSLLPEPANAPKSSSGPAMPAGVAGDQGQVAGKGRLHNKDVNSDSSKSNEDSQQGDSDKDSIEPEEAAKQAAYNSDTAGGGDGGGTTTGTDLEMEGEAGMHVANYGVGKRFKKLQRILSSPLAERAALRLRAHIIILMVVMLLAHTVTFALLFSKLKVQRDAVMDLNSVAMASRRVHEIAINGRLLDTLYGGNSYVEGLTQFGDPLEDTIADVYTDIKRVMAQLKELHHGVYLGFRSLRRIPTDFGLRDIWDNPSINISLFYDQNDPAAPEHLLRQASEGLPSGSRMMGLWDAGNLYLSKSLDLYNNGDSIVSKGVNFTAWSTWRFIQMNGPPAIFPAYLATLNALVRLTVQASNNIYQLQLIILCLEGGFLCVAAAIFMWISTSKFARWRHSLYSVFLQIPIGVARGLANMSLQLEGDEEDEEANHVMATDTEPALQTEGDPKTTDKIRRVSVRMELGAGNADGQKRTHSTSLTTLDHDKYDTGLEKPDEDGEPVPGTGSNSSSRFRPTGGGIFGALTFWRRRGKGMSAPIAALNIINETLVRFHRMVYYTLVLIHDYQQIGTGTGTGGFTIDLDEYYQQRYDLASSGVLFLGSTRPANLLYFTDVCTAADSQSCQPEGSRYFQVTRNGLDVLLKAQFGSLASLLQQSDDVSGLNSTEFNMLWATGQSDMEGGLSLMSELFHSEVQNAYSTVEIQQIAMFITMWVLVVGFSVVTLRPFVAFAKNEMRRIAELLSQLPTEINVEGLLTRVILGADGMKAAAAARKNVK
ncbi:Tiny macrocysts protein C, partial [Tetrabaena socialis]